ncbi:MAG: hypothetical protein J5I92_15390 [Thiogranum sp.]|nr:hypothetical protein [Thiogranum sp.]
MKLSKYIGLLVGAGLGATGAATPAAPVISELLYDAAGTDAGTVFVELFGTPGQSLDGLFLDAVNGSGATAGAVYMTVPLSGIFPADGVFVIGDGSGGVTSVPGADFVADVDFQNGPDSVVLRTETTILDAVGYGIFAAGDVFAGEGLPATDPASGSSIFRFNPFLDTNDNSVDFGVLGTPTPGTLPAASAVPLPASLLLLISGMIPLMIPRRRTATAREIST